MLLVHIGIASLRQFQCAPTTYVNAIHRFLFTINFFHKFLNYFLMLQCNEHMGMNKLLCSLVCTWITIIDSQLYIIDSLSVDVSLE